MSGVAVENPFAGQGSVLLDIGDDVGALVVTMPAEMVGEEVDIEGHPAGPAQGRRHGHHDHGGGHRPHVAVVARPVADGTVPSLVYPELVEGIYHLRCKDTDDVRLTVRIRGGEVTTAAWPE
jgi:hypothetical protein